MGNDQSPSAEESADSGSVDSTALHVTGHQGSAQYASRCGFRIDSCATFPEFPRKSSLKVGVRRREFGLDVAREESASFVILPRHRTVKFVRGETFDATGDLSIELAGRGRIALLQVADRLDVSAIASSVYLTFNGRGRRR